MADIAKIVDKAYEGNDFADLVNAPVDALQGVSEGDAALLGSSLNIKNIGDLARNKYVQWAIGIAALSDGPLSSHVDKAYEGKELSELANAPVDALQGISAADAEALLKAFGVKTIGDLARNKYVRWAIAVQALSGN
jgi:hypothetical protein